MTIKLGLSRPARSVFFGYLNKLKQIITTPELINLDAADVQAVISGAARITMVAVEASGNDKSTRIGDELKQLIPEAQNQRSLGAFFHITGNSALTLSEVNDIAEVVYTFLRDDAQIILGASIDEELNNSIELLLLLAE